MSAHTLGEAHPTVPGLRRLVAGRIRAEGTCWIWTGRVRPDGYGEVWWRTSYQKAHRYVWTLAHHRPPEGPLDHICRSRACVNPDHLRETTTRENTLAGIGPTAVNARRVACVNGHPFNAENTRHYRGRRYCRQCQRDRKRKYRAVAQEARRPGLLALADLCDAHMAGWTWDDITTEDDDRG